MKHLALKYLSLACAALMLTACGGDDDSVLNATSDTPRVLWLGTSIPAGCTYPQYACEQNGVVCVNRAIGASVLCLPDMTKPVERWSGYALTMTKDEIDATFTPYVKNGTIKSKLLKDWKANNYEAIVARDVPTADIIIVDHGFNDRETLAREAQQDYDAIDWAQRDRTTFIGAFGYLYDAIRKVNPTAKICIGGYFENNGTIGYTAAGRDIATVSEWIAKHYGLYLLDAWNYIDIPDGYMPNSAHYLDDLNREYKTDYKPVWTDDEGNITYFQKFCPDGVHPFTDPTGNSDRILNEVFNRLLRNLINDNN